MEQVKGRNKFIQTFEQFGRSFLLPVSVLPASGILKGIGTAFTNEYTLEMYPWMKNEALQFVMKLFVMLGDVAFNNLPVIFAVGVAVGLAKHERGSAALSGLLGFLVLHSTLNFLLTFFEKLVNTSGMDSLEAKLALAHAMQTKVLGIETMDLSVFGGIITGIVVYQVHKKAVKITLPPMVGFFSGPRLVPILIIPAMAVVAVGFFFVWPTVQQGINFISVGIVKSGYVGTFLYGLIERLLLPFGLHHGLNWPIRTTALGGVYTIGGQEYAGTINAYMAALQNGGPIDPMITRFSGGKFVYFMFGLAGAGMAMYRTARPEKKKLVASLIFAAAGTAFITGITEPIEFTFLFVAPVLYIVHAFLAGFALLVMHLLGAAFLTPTGHGVLNWFIYGVLQGTRTKWYLLIPVGIAFFFIYYFVFKILIVKLNLETPGREKEGDVKLVSKEEARNKYGVKTLKSEMAENVQSAESTSLSDLTIPENLDVLTQANLLIKAHGGRENIEDVDACITRLRINVKDKSKVDGEFIKEKLKALGFVQSGMQMQSIYGAHANVLKIEIREILGLGD